MSITDELREWASRQVGADTPWSEVEWLAAIADRIDAEHEAKVTYWQGASYKDGYDEGYASADDWCAQHEDAMAEHGWVRLPKDADGEYIHVGDVMEWPDGCDEPFVVVGIGTDTLYYMYDDSCEWTQASTKRHYKQPTVEDVLREMADRCYADEDEPRDRDAIVAEYAKRLRLAGSDAE